MIKKIIVFLTAAMLFAIMGVSVWVIYQYGGKKMVSLRRDEPADVSFTAFVSADEFKKYLVSANAFAGSSPNLASEGLTFDTGAIALDSSSEMALGQSAINSVERTSSTNVQVVGIDEPDSIKTNGESIFLSSLNTYYQQFKRIVPESTKTTAVTRVINALPVDQLAQSGEIPTAGNIVLHNSTLIVFSAEVITGYNVAQPASPVQIWQIQLSDQTQYQTARLHQDTLYVITSSAINESQPCPFTPITLGEQDIAMECNEIYHPTVPAETDATFTVMELDPATGVTTNKISFVGSINNAVFYMSANNLYLTSAVSVDVMTLMLDFLNTTDKGIMPDDVVAQLRKVNSYEISTTSKMVELAKIIENYHKSLSNDDRLKLENDMENRIKNYVNDHKREFTKTTIARLALDQFSIAATGQVPGTLLNQFSLDEHEDSLRLATTVGSAGGIIAGMIDQDQQTNDLYVLDKDLRVSGKIEDLGTGERVYSARFIGDQGYVVTFKQTDPFFVFDLSNPSQPKKTGELKIPGYSSYLHPLSKTMILGVGKEGANVKLSLFDVTDPANPIEKSRYDVTEYSSDILTTHHAFMLDDKHDIFFIPGNKGGYVFSYANNTLELKKAISEIEAERALYINDYLYIIGHYGITVLSENDWSEVGKLELATEPVPHPDFGPMIN